MTDDYSDDGTPDTSDTDRPVPVPADTPATGEAPPWIEDYVYEKVDVSHIDGIDADEHDIGCSCGCRGEATVISESGEDGAYIASTLDSTRYIGSRS